MSGPTGSSVGDIIILPSYGESAEWWFETASDLNRKGYTVWVLESEGQGGSGRSTAVRDLGHVTDSNADIDGLRVFSGLIVRSAPDRPHAVIASGTAALTALAAVEKGLVVDRMILTSPDEPKLTDAGVQVTLASVGLVTLRAKGGGPWKRPAPGAARTPRERTALGWAVANPDLRMGGPSTGWLRARERIREDALAPENIRRATVAVTVLAADGAPQFPCASLPRCQVRPVPGRLPYHIEHDEVRAAWLTAVFEALGTDHAS